MIVIVPSDKYGNGCFDRRKWEDARIWTSGVAFSPDNEKTLIPLSSSNNLEIV